MFGVATRNGFSMFKCSSAVTSFTVQSVRSTAIFKRMYPPPLYSKKATGPFRPKLRRRQFVYIMEENLNHKPVGNMDVILATDVEGLGFQGDVVNVTKRLARNHMLPVGVAEYFSPENLEKFEQIRKEREHEKRQSLTAHQTMKKLQMMTLPIPMSSTVAWTLNSMHVKVAFRTCGVELTEDQIVLPEEPVSEAKEIVVKVTVNGLHTIPVTALVYYYNKAVAPTLPPVWSDSPAAQFNIFEVISVAAHRMRSLTYARGNDAGSTAGDNLFNELQSAQN